MIIGNPPPLSIAAKILKPETIEIVRSNPSFNFQGRKILDRWAFNTPEKLKALEKQGEVVLFDRLLGQQATELDLLRSPTSLEQLRTGVTEREILEMHEINTEL